MADYKGDQVFARNGPRRVRESDLDRSQVVDSKDGEMSEWLKEHAWKLIPAARADAHQVPPTHFRATTSSYNDVRQRILVSRGVCPGFQGVCDTVLTQRRDSVKRTNIGTYH
jgi:hypothetical protein